MSWNYNYTQLNKIITCLSHNVFLKKFNTSPPPKIVSLVLTWTGASFLISCVFLCKKKIIIKNKIKNNDIWSSTENKMWNPYFGTVDNKVTYNS